VVLNQSDARRGARQDGQFFNPFYIASGEIASTQEHRDAPEIQKEGVCLPVEPLERIE
jgi:hypothetical protein